MVSKINERDRLKPNEDASICTSLVHKVEENSPQVARNHKLDDRSTGIDSEKDYITRIVNLAGIKTDSSTTMFSSSHTLDPSIFGKLEHIGELDLMDIDHLVEKKKLEEEGEDIIGEIEREIVDALVRETVSELSLNFKRGKTTSDGK